MGLLPFLSGKSLIKILGTFGYQRIRQRGSHIRLSCPKEKIYYGARSLKHWARLLQKILRDAEISMEEFLRVYKR